MLVFYILMFIVFAMNIFHINLHLREYGGKPDLLPYKYVSPMVSFGWFAWVAMLFTDPIRVSFGHWRIPGLFAGVLGIVLVYLGHRDVPFEDQRKLVTTGVFAYVPHPIYYGSILCLVGFPVATGSLYTLYASFFLVILNLYWRHMEEKNLIKRFGSDYKDYKMKTKI